MRTRETNGAARRSRRGSGGRRLPALSAGAVAAVVWGASLGAPPDDGSAGIAAPGPPESLDATAASASEVELAWSPPPDLISTIDHYNVYRDGTKVGESPDTTFTDGGLRGSTQYVYRVSAVNLTGAEGRKSEPDSATTPDGTAPTPPSSLSAAAGGARRIDLEWDAASDPESGVDHYHVYRDGSRVGESPAPDFSDTDRRPGTSYSYRVSAVNGAGLESEKSGETTVTTERSRDTAPPAPPKNLREVSGS